MNHKALLQLGSELMFQFRHGGGAADRTLSEYLRTRKFLGARDKAFLSDVFFHTLRHLRRYDEAIDSAFQGTIAAERRFSSGFPVTSDEGARAWARPMPGVELEKVDQRPFDHMVDTIRLGIAATELGLDTPKTVAEELARFWPKVRNRRDMMPETIERMMERVVEVAELYAHARRPADADRARSFPPWLWALIGMGRAPADLDAIGATLNEQAPVTVRVNTLRTTMEEACAALDDAGVRYRRGENAPEALVFEERQARGKLPHFSGGWFEMQDEGSQLVSVYTLPQPGMTVVDACAGGGGKTLHLAALMKNEGRLIARDKDAGRLSPLPRRAERAGVTNIDTESTGPIGNADIVLIDAPCSGTGTLRRNPENRWRLTPFELEELRKTQMELLDEWAGSVKPGALLVYATCSLLAAENQEQIDRFLAYRKDYRLEAPTDFTGPMTSRGELQTLPSTHGCDGLYAARLRRHS